MWDMRWYIANEALHRVGYNHLISYKHKKNNVFFIKNATKNHACANHICRAWYNGL